MTRRLSGRGRQGLLVELLQGVRGAADAPMYRRLYRHLRDGIVSGALPPSQRLPSSRTLAADLGLSRNTVEAALTQLTAEGFIVRQVGVGTVVSPRLPRPALPAQQARGSHARGSPMLGAPARSGPVLSARGRATLAADHLVRSFVGYTFAPCIPDADALPSAAWRRALTRRSRRWSGADTMPPDPAGYRPLREAIAAYVVSSRGVRCDWRQVLVVGSVQQGLALVARMLLDPGDAVWLEDPGYPGARTAFAASGARTVPVPVDGDGIDVAAGERLAPDARLAYVTPSHQYPLGVTLTLERRLALLAWARQREAWIVEDDYDSEFRYVGRPLAAIQGLDDAGRTIYAGTFSKILFPSVRLAYLVLPPGLLEPFAAAQDVTGGVSSTFLQATAAEFLESGQFAAHLRKVRDLFAERRAAVLEAGVAEWDGLMRLGACDTGLHVVGHLPAGRDDRALSAAAERRRLDLPALSRYYADRSRARGLLVHYAGTPVPMIRDGARTLARLLAG
ncbi:MAG TPA: PLP-dependent aminotransferase family protein [Gemmatimonadales bacterium]|nr:PLP-dependent aminotransferase family protein [Gemmatimonadales bacterium]